jgi:hypothetical protein
MWIAGTTTPLNRSSTARPTETNPFSFSSRSRARRPRCKKNRYQLLSSYPVDLCVTTPDLVSSLAPTPSWLWFALAALLAPLLSIGIDRSVLGRWRRLIPVFIVLVLLSVLPLLPPTEDGGLGVLVLALIASLGAVVVFPAFDYALGRFSRPAALLASAGISIGILFVLAPSPVTGLGSLLVSVLGLQGAATLLVVGFAFFVFSLLTAGIGFAFVLFMDEIADRMSSVVSGLLFGALLLIAGLGVGEAVAGGLLAYALLHYIRIAPEKGMHMFLLLVLVAGSIVLTSFADAYPQIAGVEAVILPLLVPAVAVITPFVLLEPQNLTRREGVATVLSALAAFPVVSLISSRAMDVPGLNAFFPLFAEPVAFETALLRWSAVYIEVLTVSLAFYLIVVMGLSALKRPSSPY